MKERIAFAIIAATLVASIEGNSTREQELFNLYKPGLQSAKYFPPQLIFPQIAVGGPIETLVTLYNQGTATFHGYLVPGTADGRALPVSVDGGPLTSSHEFSIPPGAIFEFLLTRSGDVVAGFLGVFADIQDPRYQPLDPVLRGNVVFRVLEGSHVIDATGVPPAEFFEHFTIPVAFSGAVRTGLALANIAVDSAAEVTFRLFDRQGRLQGAQIQVYERFRHRAQFVDELFHIPQGFLGVLEVRSDRPLCVLALRSEGFQLSSLPPSPYTVVFDITINLFPYGQYSGELRFTTADTTTKGFLRIWDASTIWVGLLLGLNVEGNFLGTAYVASEVTNQGAIATLAGSGVSAQSRTWILPIVWVDDLGERAGSMTGVRRD